MSKINVIKECQLENIAGGVSGKTIGREIINGVTATVFGVAGALIGSGAGFKSTRLLDRIAGGQRLDSTKTRDVISGVGVCTGGAVGGIAGAAAFGYAGYQIADSFCDRIGL